MSWTFAAAPGGARVGFTASGGPGGQVVITVAPKLWRPDARSTVVFSKWAKGQHHDLVLYETDRLHVNATDPDLDDVLTRCLDTTRRTSSGAVRWDSALLVPDVAPKASVLINARSADSELTHTATDLLNLLERVDLLSPRAEELRGMAVYSPLHRPLLCRRLLDRVTDLLRTVRPAYRATTSTRTAIRGRVGHYSLFRHQATGDPRLTCHYDELTVSTELLGIICAGLERIADGHGIRSPFTGGYSERSLRHDAVVLRRALSDVQTVSAAVALNNGHRLHLSRLEQPWAEPLNLALALLAETEVVASNRGAQGVEAVELSASTSALWERIVHRVLIRAGLPRVLSQRQQPIGLVADPWESDRSAVLGTHPDHIAWTGSEIVIVDAKYKMLSPEAAPARDDQYQMFAYTHLVAEHGSRVRCAVLVYPGHGLTMRWRRGRDGSVQPVELLAMRVPFPTAAQVRTATTWNGYLDAAADDFLIAWKQAVNRSSAHGAEPGIGSLMPP